MNRPPRPLFERRRSAAGSPDRTLSVRGRFGPLSSRSVCALLCSLLACALPAVAQNGGDRGGDRDDVTMSVEDYEPISTLRAPQHPITRARFPFVDVHAHLRAVDEADVDRLVREMDAMNMAVAVNLSGGSGERFRQIYEATAGRYPGRFVQFANVDFRGIDEPGWTERAVRQLEEDVKAGASGLKVFKNLGMFTVDSQGNRVRTDDPRIDPVWAKCGELGIPVLIHTGEPSPFWSAWDEHNERWLELKQYPNRRRDDAARFASFDQTMEEQWNVFRKHSGTRFISAHLSWLGNDLERLGRLLDEIPNMYTELGAVIAEIGRQPRQAREFLTKYQDRVLMGKDSWEPSEYHVYFRIFETADEYFDYYRKRHAHWKMYGLDLPVEVLRKIYYENALAIIPGIDRSLFER
ncbi:MAG TPA: amidohydrolase family protein [Thermoanaerobaculia bacterium]|nr:amidohydrolase family protein [Thermoanaerobaculia bacterium]